MFKTTACVNWNKIINSNYHYAYCVFTDEKDIHVESLDSGGTSTVPSEVVASVQPEDEQGLLSLAVIRGY